MKGFKRDVKSLINVEKMQFFVSWGPKNSQTYIDSEWLSDNKNEWMRKWEKQCGCLVK